MNSRFSRVISILNSDSQINAQLNKTNHFGSLIWDGKNPNIVQLVDVPRQAPVKEGDTIRLFNDMTNIGYVYVIENLDREEILELEKEDEQ